MTHHFVLLVNIISNVYENGAAVIFCKLINFNNTKKIPLKLLQTMATSHTYVYKLSDGNDIFITNNRDLVGILC